MMSTDNESPRILRVAETASTNSLLRELVIKESLAEGSVVVADFQTAGRGQIGNTWESEAGKNLMFSLVLYPTCIPANRQFLISQIAALSVKETLDSYTDHVTVKWPNDICTCGWLVLLLWVVTDRSLQMHWIQMTPNRNGTRRSAAFLSTPISCQTSTSPSSVLASMPQTPLRQPP